MGTASSPSVCRNCHKAHWLRDPCIWDTPDPEVVVNEPTPKKEVVNKAPYTDKVVVNTSKHGQYKDKEARREYMRSYMQKRRAV